MKSYISGACSTPLSGMTIGEKFDEIAMQFAEKEALVVVHQNIRWTYKELQLQVNKCAKSLLACGLKKGDRVGIWAPNRSEWTVLQFAAAKVGVILVNINPSYRNREVKYALQQSGCKLLVLAEKFKTSFYTQMILDILPELQNSAFGQLYSEELPELKMTVVLSDNSQQGFLSWHEFMAKSSEMTAEKLSERQNSLAFDDPINIQYTSGTTGYPKGATLSHHNILNNSYFVAKTMNFTENDRLVIPVPLYHCFGMVMGNLGCLTHGATMIYPSEGFDPLAVLQAIETEKATALYGVPTMFIAELKHPEFEKFDLKTLRTGIMAGSPCPIEVMKKVKDIMGISEIQIAYGMTETSPVSTQTRKGTSLEKQVSTVGQVLPHIEIKIIDEINGLPVPIGHPGELCVRGYSVMLGYWNDLEKTQKAIDSARWMHTGDIAIMDKEGFINIVGRIKDMIIRGGENIYPREIEEYLYTHPKVSEVQVISIPSIEYGEEVMAWVQPKESTELTAEELIEFCKGQIAHYKVPRNFKLTNDFPMTETGKFSKEEMREISINELGLHDAEKIKTA